TMDELSEILCLMQESKMPKMPVFLVGGEFWKTFDRIIGGMMGMKLISVNDTKIFNITDDINDIVKAANRIGHPKISENFYDGFREASSIM
ncbi:LOG family protein, partial [Candidatus Saccharibacteria bacterium]|nr:LOG family protein [Candidatus Saccharibacteria bacterium]